LARTVGGGTVAVEGGFGGGVVVDGAGVARTGAATAGAFAGAEMGIAETEEVD